MYIRRTYLIDHYNPSVRIIEIVSHITCVVCVNFIHKGRHLQFKVVAGQNIFFVKFFMATFIYSQSLCQKYAEKKSPKNTFPIVFFWCLAWGSNIDFMSNQPTHYLLDSGKDINKFISKIVSVFFGRKFPLFMC